MSKKRTQTVTLTATMAATLAVTQVGMITDISANKKNENVINDLSVSQAIIDETKAKVEAAKSEVEKQKTVIDHLKQEKEKLQASITDVDIERKKVIVNDIETATNTINEIQEAITKLEEELVNQNEIITSKQTTIDTIKKENEKLSASIAEQEVELEPLATQIAEVEAIYEEEKAAYDEQKSILENLQQEVNEITTAKEQAEQALRDAETADANLLQTINDEKAELERIIQEKNQQIESLSQSITDKDTQINQKQQAINQVNTDIETAAQQVEEKMAAYEAAKQTAREQLEIARNAYNNAGYEYMNQNTIDGYKIEDWINYAKSLSGISERFDESVFRSVFKVENLEKAADLMIETNTLRADPTNPNGAVEPVKMSYELMGFSASSVAISTRGLSHDFFTSARGNMAIANAENVAAGLINPLDGWYRQERQLYEAGEREYSRVGHFLNIVDAQFSTKIGTVAYSDSGISAQNFSIRAVAGSTPVTPEEFKSKLQEFVANINQALRDAENNLSNLEANEPAELVTARQNLATHRTTKERLETELATLNTEKSSLVEEKNQAVTTLTQTQDTKRAQITELESQAKATPIARQRLNEITRLLNEKQTELTSATSEFEPVKTAFETLDELFNQAREQFNDIRRPLDEKIAALQTNQAELSAVENELESTIQVRDRAAQLIDNLKNNLEESRATLETLQIEKSECDQEVEQLQKLESQLSELLKQEVTEQQKLVELETLANKLNAYYASLKLKANIQNPIINDTLVLKKDKIQSNDKQTLPKTGESPVQPLIQSGIVVAGLGAIVLRLKRKNK